MEAPHAGIGVPDHAHAARAVALSATAIGAGTITWAFTHVTLAPDSLNHGIVPLLAGGGAGGLALIVAVVWRRARASHTLDLLPRTLTAAALWLALVVWGVIVLGPYFAPWLRAHAWLALILVVFGAAVRRRRARWLGQVARGLRERWQIVESDRRAASLPEMSAPRAVVSRVLAARASEAVAVGPYRSASAAPVARLVPPRPFAAPTVVAAVALASSAVVYTHGYRAPEADIARACRAVVAEPAEVLVGTDPHGWHFSWGPEDFGFQAPGVELERAFCHFTSEVPTFVVGRERDGRVVSGKALFARVRDTPIDHAAAAVGVLLSRQLSRLVTSAADVSLGVPGRSLVVPPVEHDGRVRFFAVPVSDLVRLVRCDVELASGDATCSDVEDAPRLAAP